MDERQEERAVFKSTVHGYSMLQGLHIKKLVYAKLNEFSVESYEVTVFFSLKCYCLIH